ncbi:MULTISPECIES: DM13 domain-containing protein [unclassified Coleofasciculus]|uniref:DM13 domain-containing protein n=1 Tax=Cyanophyceae TaxID=3028117 RepID=UPI001689432C|nr:MULTISPECIES: DM13 domain-containing protein [unclassified Coleofasciculus]MBD2084832.1 DM13 domain-containing protein [Coleofasciculus sp. FACHB-542]MBD2537230.1 DM13 domain-containing protein [Coleofasciculus sp. FACHB-SPT36]
MKLKGNTIEANFNQPNVQPAPLTGSSATSVAQTPTKSGTFQGSEHHTQGTVRLVTENGKRYLELDRAFKTDNGLDLFVILYRSEKPPTNGIKEKDYVSIGRLQKISGAQRYAIPASVNPAEFGSVVIWCRLFNPTFGFAPFSS